MTSDLAVLGVDPGARWTAGVLRVGDEAVDGWTLGPTTSTGALDQLGDVDDLPALVAYTTRVLERIDETVDAATHRWGRVRVAVETIRVPVGWRHGRGGRITLGDWLTPRSLVVAITAVYPAAVLVAPAGHGRAPRSSYPSVLRLRRPPTWGPNDHPRGERDHERAAYDIAGAAAAGGAR